MAASDLIITLTRKEFYERIWTTPMSALVKEFDVTPSIIMALCDKHQIPRPARGYWSKALHGKAPQPAPLPPTENDNNPIKIVPRGYYAARWDEQMAEQDRMLERRRKKIIEEELWERLTGMVEDWRQAQTIRSFLSALAKTVADDEKLAGKAKQLINRMQHRLKGLDPMSYNPSLVFEIMEEPVELPEHWDLL